MSKKPHHDPKSHHAKHDEVKKHFDPKGEEKASTPGSDSADGHANEAKKETNKVSEVAKPVKQPVKESIPANQRKFPKGEI